MRCIICWNFLGFNISLLIHIWIFSNELDSYLPQKLLISELHFWYIPIPPCYQSNKILLLLLILLVLSSEAEKPLQCRCSQFQSWDRTKFQWSDSRFCHNKTTVYMTIFIHQSKIWYLAITILSRIWEVMQATIYQSSKFWWIETSIQIDIFEQLQIIFSTAPILLLSLLTLVHPS